MAKYEIMLIVDPKEDFKNVETLVHSVMETAKIKKMEQTELAYEINKSKTATYALIDVNADGEQIKELTRKTNISKTIWRMLAINLDTEMGREEGLKKLAKRRAEFAVMRKERESRRETEYRSREKTRTSTTDNKAEAK